MISYNKKFILITPQKVGSTSLVTALKSYISILPRPCSSSGLHDFKKENFDYQDDFEFEYAKHNTLHQYYDNWNKVKQQKQQGGLDIGEINDYFIAGAIRNPFDRLVSWWGKEGSLLEFIKNMPTVTDNQSQLSLWPWFGVFVDEDFNSAGLTTAELRSETPQLVELHLDMFCIRFENLQEGFDTFCDKVNIPRQVLPHKNKSDHKHYTEYYDTESRELVEKMYAKDLEYFGYKFGD